MKLIKIMRRIKGREKEESLWGSNMFLHGKNSAIVFALCFLFLGFGFVWMEGKWTRKLKVGFFSRGYECTKMDGNKEVCCWRHVQGKYVQACFFVVVVVVLISLMCEKKKTR